MRLTRLSFLMMFLIVCAVSVTWGHYLWVAIEPPPKGQAPAKEGDPTFPERAGIYFEERPFPGDGEYLVHFHPTGESPTLKTWVRTLKHPEPKLLETSLIEQDGKKWFRANLSEKGPRSVDCYGKFGVYLYGKTPVLLHYHSRCLDVTDHEDLHDLGRAEQMLADIVPHDHGADMELTLLWQGKPAADRTMKIRGPNKFSQNLQTDAKGRVKFTVETAGQYTFQSYIELATPGEEGDAKYELVRHHALLVMQLPLEK